MTTFDLDTPHQTLDLPGGRAAYYRFGEGPPVLAVHGWPLRAATWRRLLPALTARFTVHLLDNPGAGQTRWRVTPGVPATRALLREAVAVLSLRDYALLGHDSGGLFARELAADNPHVRALAVIGTEIPGYHPRLLKTYLQFARLPGAGPLFGTAMQFGPLRRSPFALGACFADPRYADGEFAELFVRPMRDPAVMAGHLAMLRGFDPQAIDDLASVHARIRAPTLCVWGERDPLFPVDRARAMLPQFAGGARLVSCPDGKLFVHEDRAEFVAGAVVPFFEAHLGAGPERHA